MRLLLLSLLLVSCASTPRQPSSAIVPVRELQQIRFGSLDFEQRAGVLFETTELKGCVLFLEGLGDSVLNHDPLFFHLAAAGYRVLFFDYPGQGGSAGSMGSTRINAYGDPFPRGRVHEIGMQAREAWSRLGAIRAPGTGLDCQGSRRLVIGWSTGGLAAYRLAWEKWADGVVLIAPGIVPNLCVGAAGGSGLPACLARSLTLEQVITPESLTTARYEGVADPHVDPIRPKRPLDAKEFAINLVSTAYLQAPFWKISGEVRGLVFLSGPRDTYVDAAATRRVLERRAPHFQVTEFEGALHEIDNEVPAISGALREKTVEFLNSVPLR